jgi:O-Antigen ligase
VTMELLRRYPPGLLALLVGSMGGLVLTIGSAQSSPLLALAGLVGMGLVLLLLRDPVLGFYLLAVMVPIERFGRFSDDTAVFEISIMRVVGVVVFIILMIHRMVRGLPIIITASLILWTTYVAIALISLTYSSDIKGGQQIASGAVGNVLFLLTMSSLGYADRIEEVIRRAKIAIVCWLFASMAICAYSIYDWHFGSGGAGGIPIDSVDPQAGAQLLEHKWSTVWMDTAEEGLGGLSLRRSMGSTSHAAVFGINLLMSIPFLLYILKTSREMAMKGLMLLGLGATLYCLLLTNTRAVIVVVIPTIGLCVLRGLIPFRGWMILAGLAAAGASLVLLPGDIFNRILNINNYEIGNSEALRIRLEYWEAGFRAIFDHWATGVGVGNRLVMLSYLRNPTAGHSTMHNIYLQTALDVGLFGWLAFMGFVGLVLFQTERLLLRFRRQGPLDAYWLVISAEVLILTVIIFGFQVDVFFFPLKAWWLIASIIVALDKSVVTADARRKPATNVGWPGSVRAVT